MNQKITEITVNLNHVEFEAMCIRCKQRWQAEILETTVLKDMECPVCLRTGYVISTGQPQDDD